MAIRDLVFILGDQLTRDLAPMRRTAKADAVILMAEVADETTYVRHHKKKIALILSAMRHFAEELRAAGWTVDYVRLDDDENTGSFRGELKRAVRRHAPARILGMLGSEHRVRLMQRDWEDATGLPVELFEDDRFLTTPTGFADWAEGRKELRMEYFYREMRRKTGLLMRGTAPEGGKWNYDAQNRKAAKTDLFMPHPPRFDPDEITSDVLDLVERRFADHIGTLRPFWYATVRQDAEAALTHFIDEALPSFGDYQDAMLEGEAFLYHSVLSAYLNLGLLDPLDLCRRAEAAWHEGHAPLNAVEGFIRQIIGWREYVRGIYWLRMPEYVNENAFGASRPLPDFYWTGETDMACMAAAIGQTIEHAYAHHIQRLMVTGNFAMLAGIDPKAVHEWYLAVYADAYEWVELPNTFGMSQFADGGLLASKPYAGSANYINAMSDHCKGCVYSHTRKTGAGACPFNALYWDFMARNREKLQDNRRLGPVLRTWDKMTDAKKTAYRADAAAFLGRLE